MTEQGHENLGDYGNFAAAVNRLGDVLLIYLRPIVVPVLRVLLWCKRRIRGERSLGT